MKLGIQHRGLQPIIVYTNDDPGLIDLDLIYGKVKFGYIDFFYRKK